MSSLLPIGSAPLIQFKETNMKIQQYGQVVVGIRPPDEVWKAMKKIWDECVEDGIDIPQSLRAFFNHEEPNPAGVIVGIAEALSWRDCALPFADEERGFAGWEIDLSKLPRGITSLRFYQKFK